MAALARRGALASRSVAADDEEPLRRFLARSARDDGPGAARAWLEVAALLHDRIAGMVAARGAQVGLAPAAHDAVVLDVHVAVWHTAQTSRDPRIGVLQLALGGLVDRCCADHLAVQLRGEAPTAAQVELAWAQHDVVAADAPDGASIDDLLAWALPELTDRRRRRVLERDLRGLPGEATALSLAMTMSTVRQHRAEANAQLRALREDFRL